MMTVLFEAGADRTKMLLPSLLVCAATAAGWLLYLVVGHDLVAHIYFQRSSMDWVNELLAGRSRHDLDFYIQEADHLVRSGALTAIAFAAVLPAFVYALAAPPVELQSNERSSPRRAEVWTAVGSYTLCVLLFFYPNLGTFGTELIGPPEDNMWYLWNIWWGSKALLSSDHALSYTTHILYPEGTSLLYNGYSFYNLFLATTLKPLLGLTATYNVLILSGYIIGGLGAWLLIRHLTGSQLCALIGGYIFAFSPAHYAISLHHVNIGSIQFLPFLILYVTRSIRHRSVRDVTLASVFFLLNAACDWNYLIQASLVLGALYLFIALRSRRPQLWLLRTMAVIVAPTLVLLGPWIYDMVYTGFAYESTQKPGHSEYVADLLGFIVPDPYHLLSDLAPISRINASYTGNAWSAAVYLGWVNLVVLLLAAPRILGKAFQYFLAFLAFLTFIILSMGTHITIAGMQTDIMLPYEFIKHLPFLGNMRVPSRWMALAYLMLAILVAISIKELLGPEQNWRRRTIGILIAGSIFIDYYSVSHEGTPVAAPTCYQHVDADEPGTAILDLPGGVMNSLYYMRYQTLHEIPIVQGSISRELWKTFKSEVNLRDSETFREQLRDKAIPYVMHHKQLERPPGEKPADTLLSDLVPVCEDDETQLFHIEYR